MTADTVSYTAYPDRFRVEAELPTGTLVQGYADERAWMQGPNGVEDAPVEVRDDFRASVRRDMIPLLLRAAGGGVEMRPLDSPVSAAGEPLAVEFLTNGRR